MTTKIDKEKELEYLKQKLKLLEAEVKLKKLRKRNMENEALQQRKRRPRCYYHGNDERCNYCQPLTMFKKRFTLKVKVDDLIEKARKMRGSASKLTAVEGTIKSLREQISQKERQKRTYLMTSTLEKIKTSTLAEIRVKETELKIRNQFERIKYLKQEFIQAATPHLDPSHQTKVEAHVVKS